MDVKLIILLGIVTIVRDENDMVVTHGLDDVFQKVSARRHILQKDPFLELAAVANHGMEGEGIEHPTSGTSFLEAVAILDVVAVSVATFDVYLKQFLDAMDVVDEGSSGFKASVNGEWLNDSFDTEEDAYRALISHLTNK